MILSGCILAAALGFFLFQAKDLSPGYVKLHTFLDDAEGLMDGTQVRLNGIPVGYLDSQRLTNSRDPQRKVRFDLNVKESYLRDIPADSRWVWRPTTFWGISTSGFAAGGARNTFSRAANCAPCNRRTLPG